MNTNIVVAKRDVIQVLTCDIIEGETVITVDCEDYQEYRSLPPAVVHTSGILTKTGWNSDTRYACYKTVKTGQLINIIA